MAESFGQPVSLPNYDRTGQPSDGFKVAIIVGLLLVVLSVPCVLVSVGLGGLVLLTYRTPQQIVEPAPPMRAAPQMKAAPAPAAEPPQRVLKD